jgi:hypothetical protein
MIKRSQKSVIHSHYALEKSIGSALAVYYTEKKTHCFRTCMGILPNKYFSLGTIISYLLDIWNQSIFVTMTNGKTFLFFQSTMPGLFTLQQPLKTILHFVTKNWRKTNTLSVTFSHFCYDVIGLEYNPDGSTFCIRIFFNLLCTRTGSNGLPMSLFLLAEKGVHGSTSWQGYTTWRIEEPRGCGFLICLWCRSHSSCKGSESQQIAILMVLTSMKWLSSRS